MNSSENKKSNCPICDAAVIFFTSKKDRFGQEYNYVKCAGCRFLFDQDLVLNKNTLEAKTSRVYNQEYFQNIDSGWKLRGEKMVKIINIAIKILSFFKGSKKITVLDYGGGNGYVTSLIDSSVNIFYYDKYEKPIYGKNYQILEKPKEADLVFAVELVEHLSDINEWDEITKLSGNVLLITTEVSDGISDDSLMDWVYLNPDAGHTAIYSFKALSLLAKKHGFFYIFFPSKLTHIFIKNRFLSKFNVVKLEYFLYKILKMIFKK